MTTTEPGLPLPAPGAVPQANRHQQNGKPAVILLVEDDLGDQELTRRALTQWKIRNDLYVVQDGEEALDYLLRRGRYAHPITSPTPHLVLLDLNLPKLDGRQVLQRIREEPALRGLVVVVLTTSKEEMDVLRSYSLGVNSYLTKPMTIQHFIQIVRALEHYWFQIVVLPPTPR